MPLPKNYPNHKCVVCDGEYRPSYKLQRYCSHKCVFKIIGDKVRHAAKQPEAIKKMAASKRGAGRGITYTKRHGRHEHRVVAEEKIGRKLLPTEIVHHIDGNIKNNSNENLQVLPNRAAHCRIHGFGGNNRLKDKGVQFIATRTTDDEALTVIEL